MNIWIILSLIAFVILNLFLAAEAARCDKDTPAYTFVWVFFLLSIFAPVMGHLFILWGIRENRKQQFLEKIGG